MAEVESVFVKMEHIKREEECCCCSNKEDLFSLLEPYNLEDKVEVYSTMIAECFRIELSSCIEECNRNLYTICKNCIFRLRDAIMLRSQIQTAYDRLQAESSMKNDVDVIKSEYSDVNETKEDILKYDISEYDNTEWNMNVDSGASTLDGNVNVKIDNTIENVSIVSAKSGSVVNFEPCSLQLQKHKKIHRNTNKTTCKHCNKTFKTNHNLLVHQKIHLNIKDFMCDYCNKGFGQKGSLKEHILSHMGVKNKKCDLCDKCFVSERSLAYHKKNSHLIKFSCNICGKTLRSKRAFDDHTSSHSGVKDQKCDVCEKTFATRSLLNKHRKIHVDANKKTCKYCNKAFTNRYYLLLHEKMHLDIKDLYCDYCKKGFRNKNNLKEHILLHTGVKNIKCDLCDKCFVSKMALSKHKRKYHSISCSVCGLYCNSKRNLTEHMKVHG